MIGDMQNWRPNVAGIIEHARSMHPSTEVVSRLVSGEIHKTNYEEVCIRSRKLASALEKDGIKKGDVIATLALNTYRHLEMYYGISGMGAITHTLNFRLHPEQAVYIINHAEDKMIFVELPFIPILEGLQDNLSTVEKYVVLCNEDEMPETSLKNALSYEEYIKNGDENYSWPDMDDDAACALCYTSGTTGNPKGVLYSHKSNILHAQVALTAMTIQADDSILMVVPLFHVLAWGIPYFGPMNGNKLVMPGMQMEGEPLYELIDKEDVTLAFGVPTIWMGLLAYCRDNNKILNSVKNTIIGGSALSLSTLQEFDEVHDVNVIHAWGMTEMSPLGTLNQDTAEMDLMELDDRYELQTSQGRAIYGCQIKIVNDEGDTLPNDGKTFGRLMVKGPAIIERYYKSSESALENGWFDTGDVSTISPDGYMRIVDRSKDVIKSGGEWISSIDLENTALGCPGVLEACVVGVAHEKWDERPLLFIVKNSDECTKESVLEYLSDKVAKWWLPDDVIFIDELPHGATGKLLKTGLREDYKNHLITKGD